MIAAELSRCTLSLPNNTNPTYQDPTITFDFADVAYELEHLEELKQWLVSIGKKEHQEISLLEYIICTDEYLLEINKEYLDHDFYTDIITFPLQEDPLEGTIYISIERVKENADLYKAPIKDELHRVMAHGLLHLLGYKDKTDAEQKEMRNKENHCLSQRSFC